uniref:Arrestin C-terminal-like domain-containing protein n=1 Tax=Globisporangium ultimum (strain ATCC 200006 / CBS 805.95 / DAOM BR144) TaxID=431595 RepID=K3WDE8_GLOUD
MWASVFGSCGPSAQLTVSLDRATYAAGDLVRGIVALCVFRDMIGDELTVRFQGEETLSWVEVDDDRHHNRHPSHEQRRAVRTKTNRFLNDKVVVFSFPRPFTKGETYEFPFLYQSHATLPGVFKMHYQNGFESSEYRHIQDLRAALTYTVRAKINQGSLFGFGNFHARCNLVMYEVPKIGIHPTTTSSDSNGSFDAKTQSVKLLSLFSQGKCETTAFLDKYVYCSGGIARIQYHVNNASQMHIQAVKVRLYQDVYLCLRQSRVRDAKPVSRRVANVEFTGIAAESEHLDTLLLALRSQDDGSELTPSMNGALIKCAYRVHIQFDIRWCADPCLDLPIVIAAAATTATATSRQSAAYDQDLARVAVVK